jgi:hypothetical protein
MPDDKIERRTERATSEPGEQRSIDPQTVIDGATAFGVATGGTGGLLVGIAKVKETFGGGGQDAVPAEPQPPAQQTTDG